MIKLLLSIFLLSLYLYASTANIEKKIENSQAILEENAKKNQRTKFKIKLLSDEINSQSLTLKKIENKIEIISQIIRKHKNDLNAAQTKLEESEKRAVELKEQKEKSEEEIVKIIIDNFSWAFALDLASKKSLNELIDSELYNVLSQNSKDEIIRLNNQYMLISNKKAENENDIVKLKAYIQVSVKRKQSLTQLQEKQEKTIQSLEQKHLAYQDELKSVIQKQKSLSDLLGKLNILKGEELKKEQERAQKLARQKKEREFKKSQKENTTDVSEKRFAKNIDLDVRMLGSSTAGVKIGKYRGTKTISPLKSYTVTKKFGTYFDPVYKIKLFNESVVLKSNEEKAKVYSVLDGKVVYAKKDSGMLENVVIIQHKNGLHTIYSHLDQISPTLKIGKWIHKGYVVGRVNDSLTFQATKNSAHINPQDLFN
ncbi:MAG: murein hydrolase activator EnvC family protein [Candidatus Marinarcus sp.]|uniref:murein hydrolase activator EnvC family protein n=1 Tax=Candidatus Marinarcus sp. TaxID=3100987 RepID=UPI003AFF712D